MRTLSSWAVIMTLVSTLAFATPVAGEDPPCSAEGATFEAHGIIGNGGTTDAPALVGSLQEGEVPEPFYAARTVNWDFAVACTQATSFQVTLVVESTEGRPSLHVYDADDDRRLVYGDTQRKVLTNGEIRDVHTFTFTAEGDLDSKAGDWTLRAIAAPRSYNTFQLDAEIIY